MTEGGRVRLACLVLAVLASGAAWAGTGKGDRDALRRMQRQVQQMQGQVATLEQDKAKLDQDLADSEKAAGAARARAARLGRELRDEQARRGTVEQTLAQANQDLAATRQRLELAEARLAETGRDLAGTRRQLAEAEAARLRLEGIKVRREKDIALCEDKNAGLYRTGRELMTRYQAKTCADVLAEREPFTGLRRVEVENLLEEYRDRLDEQRLVKPPGG